MSVAKSIKLLKKLFKTGQHVVHGDLDRDGDGDITQNGDNGLIGDGGMDFDGNIWRACFIVEV